MASYTVYVPDDPNLDLLDYTRKKGYMKKVGESGIGREIPDCAKAIQEIILAFLAKRRNAKKEKL